MTRVLIVDDSCLVRTILRDLLQPDPEIEVIAEAGDGRSAVDMTRELRPDLVIMDVMMPVMDGLDAISEIMAECPTPVLVLSANTDPQDNRNAFTAIRMGALDVMPKPGGRGSDAFEEIASQLRTKVKSLSRIKVIHHFRRRPQPPAVSPPPLEPRQQSFSLLAIGASTGGPQAILQLLRALPPRLPAAGLIVQHIAAGFAPGFAAWLQRETGQQVRLAEPDMPLHNGQFLVAPNGFHLTVAGGKVRLSDAPPQHNCRPAVDCLFQSLATSERAAETVALLLTGMGQDGAAGLLALKQRGALTLVQDQQSSAIFGMPKAAIDRGAATQVLALEQMPEVLRNCFQSP